MDDLTINRLCAEAVGWSPIGPEWNSYGLDLHYDPLHNDAQAFALVKRFDMVIEREKDNSFGITLFGNERKGGHPTYIVRNEPNLNRAVCTAVATLQASKRGG